MEIFDTRTQLENVKNRLRDWAAEHADHHPDIFVVLDHVSEEEATQERNPGGLDLAFIHESQKLTTHTLKGHTPVPAAAVDTLAEHIEPRYPEIASAIDANQPALSLIGNQLDARQNVILGTDHGEIIDIAVLLARVRNNLQSEGQHFETGIIVNKMASYLGVKLGDAVVPALQILQMGFNEIYLNLPNTRSGNKRLSIPHAVISKYNRVLVEHGIQKRLEQSRKVGRAMLLGVALSGTVNKWLDTAAYDENHRADIPESQRDRTHIIGKVSEGIIKLASNALVVPASTHLVPGEIQVKIADRLFALDDARDIVRLMNTVATMHNDMDQQHHYVYDRDGTLPVLD
jgi:hypothetical protein